MAWTLDPAHTLVGFSAKHLGVATVRGRFNRFSGEIDLDPSGDPTTARGRIEIDAASIDTGMEARDNHLRGADFFDAATYPTITFTPTKVTPAGESEFTVTGDLTIKDVTREVTLSYEHGGVLVDPMGNTKLGGSLSGTINRSDWGLTWNVPFGNGGMLVSDKIKLEVDGELTLVTEPAQTEAEVAGARA